MAVGHLFLGLGLCARPLEEQRFHRIQQAFSIPGELMGLWVSRRYPRQSELLLGEGMIPKLRRLKQSTKGERHELFLVRKPTHSYSAVFKV